MTNQEMIMLLVLEMSVTKRAQQVLSTVATRSHSYTDTRQDYVNELARVTDYNVADVEDVVIPVEQMLHDVADEAFQLGYYSAAQRELSIERYRYAAHSEDAEMKRIIGEVFDGIVATTLTVGMPVDTLLMKVRVKMSQFLRRTRGKQLLEHIEQERQVSTVMRVILPYTSARSIQRFLERYRVYLREHCPELSQALETYTEESGFTVKQLRQLRHEWNSVIAEPEIVYA